MSTTAIVLAAGKGTRMKCDLPKVLHTVAGKPIVNWVVDAVRDAGADRVVVVVGHGAELVVEALPAGIETVVQQEQGGTGHATRVALEALGSVDGDTVLVVPGDSPLFDASTLRSLLESHDGAATLLTTRMPDPTGYGRVIRDGESVVAIVEESDADEATRAIHEVAVSTYVFSGTSLSAALDGISRDNEQGEEYLTDVIEVLAADRPVRVHFAPDHVETLGVNSHEQLADAERFMRARINSHWMAEGVWMQDPDRVYIDATVTVDAGVRLLPGVHLEGSTTVAAGAVVGPDTFVMDSSIGKGARVGYSVVRSAQVGDDVSVGPYASLRPGTVLERGSKAGTFVEIKATTVGEGSKVPHLAYVGDASIGKNSNLGAGTITCNYDGFKKHRTVIGDNVFIGSDTMLVAPVEVGDGAYTGAGSVITKDVGAGSLAVERSPQKEIAGYAERRARLAESEDE